ncbi:MAG: ECF transporter S component [Lachnospiraceae bacterium]
MKKKKLSTKQLVEMALLIAIILLMAFTPIGYIRTPGLEITLIIIPVAIGAVTLGPTAGAILGAVFGLTSFIQCFGMSVFGTALLQINPLATFVVTVVTRTLVGWLTGLIYLAFVNLKVNRAVSVIISSLACPLLNTSLFMSALVLFFYNSDYIQGFADMMGTANVFAFIFAFVGVNGLIEAIVCCIVGSAVIRALQITLKN